MERREFLKRTSGVAAFSTIPGTVLGANDRLRLGFIGCGNISRRHVHEFMLQPNVEIAALCDVYATNLQERLAMVKKAGGTNVQTVADYRKLLERKDLDIIVTNTPDHWHALMTIEACQAGKDVYVEKPISHNIYESQQMVKAARLYKRVVQVGTQQRSGPHFQKAMALVREGHLGKISQIRCMNTANVFPSEIGNLPDTPPPDGMDWDFWLGPAPYKPHNRNYWDNFRKFWDYAGGFVSDWFAHWLDIVQPAMNVRFPNSVVALGGRYHLQDNGETHDTLQAVLEYNDFIVNYNVCQLSTKPSDRITNGITFFGTDATMYLSREGYEIFPESDQKDGERVPRIPAEKHPTSEQKVAHVAHFIDCVRNRKRPVSDIEDGYWTSVGIHLTNIAARTKSRVEWDAKNERIINNPAAETMFKREYRAPWRLPSLG